MEKEGTFHKLFNDIPVSVEEAFKFAPEKQRLLWYTDKIPKHKWNSVYYSETDTHLYYSESLVGVKMGKVLYPNKMGRKGFTYDKKTNKAQMWYGSAVGGLFHLTLFFKAYGLEWATNEGLKPWLTKTLLEKIISKSITNPKEAAQHIIKVNRLKASPEILRQYIKSGKDKNSLLFINGAISDLDDFLRDPDQVRTSDRFDLAKQAKALSRTFDWNWSDKRLNDLHTEWTREIMKAEIDSLEDEVIDLPELPLPTGFELISTKRRCFEEGMIMHHCIYTNYWDMIESKRYLVFRVEDEDANIATAGIRLNPVRLDQVRSRFNKQPSDKIMQMVSNLLADKDFVDRVKNIQNTPERVNDSPFLF